jgi:hypothetical protein
MSDRSTPRASLISILAIFFLFAMFYFVVRYFYKPEQGGAFVDDGIHTSVQRKENLKKLHDKEAAQASHYAWVDQKTGVVQLPLDRAVELTLQKYSAKP